MAPLSDILGLLKPNSHGFHGLNAGGDWTFRLPPSEDMKCYAIRSGACWIAIDGMAEATGLTAGDFVLMPGRNAFWL